MLKNRNFSADQSASEGEGCDTFQVNNERMQQTITQLELALPFIKIMFDLLPRHLFPVLFPYSRHAQ